MANIINGGYKFKYLKICSILIFLVTGFAIYYYSNLKVSFDDPYWLTFAVFPLIIIIGESPWINKMFHWKGWTFFAKSSFNVYIWHLCVIILAKMLYQPDSMISANIYMIISLLVAELIGIISFEFIEKPSAKLINELLKLN